ncbi:MAG: FixH family protein [Pirellulaceae bacterium]|nr:FixH family protein [Pirellulaceae bacterium]
MSGVSRWLILGCLVLLVACRPATSDVPGAQVDLTWDPAPPAVGQAQLLLRLRDAAGQPLAGGKVRLEGNMNHAGMKPSFGELNEVEPGSYAGTLEFTMGGDWFVLVTATFPDGTSLERKVDVAGVKAR